MKLKIIQQYTKLIRGDYLDKNINLENAVKTILKEIGEDLNREGLIDTPKRVSKSLREILNGYNENIEEIMSISIIREQSAFDTLNQ